MLQTQGVHCQVYPMIIGREVEFQISTEDFDLVIKDRKIIGHVHFNRLIEVALSLFVWLWYLILFLKLADIIGLMTKRISRFYLYFLDLIRIQIFMMVIMLWIKVLLRVLRHLTNNWQCFLSVVSTSGALPLRTLFIALRFLMISFDWILLRTGLLQRWQVLIVEDFILMLFIHLDYLRRLLVMILVVYLLFTFTCSCKAIPYMFNIWI